MITRNQLKVLLAFGVGSGLGSLVAYRMAKKSFESELEKEIADVKANYRLLRKEDYETPTDFLEKKRPEILRDEALAAMEINSIIEHAKLNAELAEEASRYNAFEREDIPDKELLPSDANETLYENLKAMRTDDAPFLISVAEYFDDCRENTKLSITYFAGDNIICYEDDSVMLDPEESFGIINLSRFGVASDSEHIVYVRNPRTSVDYEIVRDDGKYADMVAHLLGPIEDD